MGAKSLFIRGSNLVYDESWEDEVIKDNFTDSRWHTVAVVYRGRKLRLYVDGELKLKKQKPVSEDKPGHVFKIGTATVNRGGNFHGDISDVLFYDEPLSEEDVNVFAKGKKPEGKLALEWKE